MNGLFASVVEWEAACSSLPCSRPLTEREREDEVEEEGPPNAAKDKEKEKEPEKRSSGKHYAVHRKKGGAKTPSKN